jgi:uncharacterized protein involved in outer membrane biogenesis
MKKMLLIGGSIVVVIIVLVVFGLSKLGPMIQSAVNTVGPNITKTDVRLGKVDVSIFSAEAELKNFYLGNPKGFKSSQAMNVESIYVNVDEGSLTKDTIVIDRVEVVAPEITYEKLRSTDNFKAILNNVQKSVGEQKPSKKQTEKKDDGKKILIKNFIVRDGNVNLVMSILGDQIISAQLPDIKLKDLGAKKGGASPAEVFDQVFKELYARITSSAVTAELNKTLKAMGKKSIDEVTSVVDKQLKGMGKEDQEGVKAVTDKLKGLFDK